MYDLHAINSSAIACDGSNFGVGLTCHWESSRGLKSDEWCDHCGMSQRRGHCSGREHNGSHITFPISSLLCELGLGIMLWLSIYNGINNGNKPQSDKRVENPRD